MLLQSNLLCLPCVSKLFCPLLFSLFPFMELVYRPSLIISLLFVWHLTPALLSTLSSLSTIHFMSSFAPLSVYPCLALSNSFHRLQRCLHVGGFWMWAAPCGSRRTWPVTCGKSWRRAVWTAIGQTHFDILLHLLQIKCDFFLFI